MGSFAVETGLALRRVRNAHRLTLRDLQQRSRNTFKASAVAAYERADRNISLERFCGLCRVYDVDPPRLLADILRQLDGRRPVVIDLARLEDVADPARDILRRFVGQVRTLRGQGASNTVTIRAGDLDVLATTAGRRGDELLDLLGGGHRRPARTPPVGRS